MYIYLSYSKYTVYSKYILQSYLNAYYNAWEKQIKYYMYFRFELQVKALSISKIKLTMLSKLYNLYKLI